jgi:peptide-methionine (S)-S-oxide reductase
MKTNQTIPLLLILILSIFFLNCNQTKTQGSMTQNINELDKIKSGNLDSATFGAGCFWCVEAIFQELNGVDAVYSGYSGGEKENPTYKEVCTGKTGHAEVTKIIFDPAIISYEELLEVFWTTHDPTTLNRQGADVGTQYRSAIFYHNEKQMEIAERSKREFAPLLWDDPVVTEISPLKNFYKAEDYHQNYFTANPDQAYCRAVINPKVKKLREKFSEKLKKN